jgi:hypothetical protein
MSDIVLAGTEYPRKARNEFVDVGADFSGETQAILRLNDAIKPRRDLRIPRPETFDTLFECKIRVWRDFAFEQREHLRASVNSERQKPSARLADR